MAQGPAFERVGDNYPYGTETVRGLVQRELVRQYLIESLEEAGPMAGRVAEEGPNEAADSRYLIESGYEFEPTVISTDKESLLASRRKVPGIKTFNGDVAAAAGRRQMRGAFDLVLSHGNLEYNYSSPADHISDLVQLTQEGGNISILTRGIIGGHKRLRREGAAPEIIETFEETGIVRDSLGRLTIAHKYEDLVAMISAAGATVMQFCGVGLDSDDDYRLWREVKYSDRLRILDADYTSGKNRNMRYWAQMLHIIAAKTPS